MNQAADNFAKTIDELRKDPRVIEAENRLKKVGFSDEWCEGLLERILNLPYKHQIANRETRSEAVERRSKLARKMKKLAGEMNEDIELKNFIPANRGGKANKECFLLVAPPGNGLLSIGGWVLECAEHLEELSASGKDNNKLSTRSGLGLKSFVVHGVYGLIDHYLAIGRDLKKVKTKPAKNTCAALLTGAVLDIEVTAQQVTKIRKDERRRYFIEK